MAFSVEVKNKSRKLEMISRLRNILRRQMQKYFCHKTIENQSKCNSRLKKQNRIYVKIENIYNFK